MAARLFQGVVSALPGPAVQLPSSLPDVFVSAAALVGQLDRYLPIHESVAVILAGVTIQGAMVALWLANKLYDLIPFKGT